MTDSKPIHHARIIPAVMQALEHVHEAMDAAGLDRTIHHLVQLRASQINGCGYCVKMHTREARADGETNDRLDRLVVWRQVGDFTPAERAALAWTEALTTLDPRTAYGELRADLRRHFSEEEVSVLTVTVAMINLWNRIQISSH